jgi:glutathione synthase/RimK-type ligase-like ATP-grasp enzyme
MKRLIKSLIDNSERVSKQIEQRSEFVGTDEEWSKDFGNGYQIGIIYDHFRQHDYYIRACHDLKVGYRVVDFRKDNWQNEVIESGVESFLIWPSIYLLEHRFFWDTRLRVLTEFLGKRVFPGDLLLWIYESKIRTKEWLTSYNYPMPNTKVFFDKKEALEFVNSSLDFPVVVKTDQAASAAGVYIIRSKKEAIKFVRRAFTWGIGLKNQPLYLRHRGYIIFQEYIQDAKEWRLIKVGESYFCRKKIKIGEFHSGSGSIEWAKPPEELLNLTKKIADTHNFSNINIDFFEDQKGKYYINELHALWGGKELEDKRLEGRYLFDSKTNKWEFQKGDFFRNRCANLRLAYHLGLELEV